MNFMSGHAQAAGIGFDNDGDAMMIFRLGTPRQLALTLTMVAMR